MTITAEWISAGIALLLILIGGVTAYNNLNNNKADKVLVQTNRETTMRELEQINLKLEKLFNKLDSVGVKLDDIKKENEFYRTEHNELKEEMLILQTEHNARKHC